MYYTLELTSRCDLTSERPPSCSSLLYLQLAAYPRFFKVRLLAFSFLHSSLESPEKFFLNEGEHQNVFSSTNLTREEIKSLCGSSFAINLLVCLCATDI